MGIRDISGTLRRCLPLLALITAMFYAKDATAVTPKHRHSRHHARASAQPVAATTTQAALLRSNARGKAKVGWARRRRGRRVFYNPWTEPTYADSTVGDNV